jgi:hypothetical protein
MKCCKADKHILGEESILYIDDKSFNLLEYEEYYRYKVIIIKEGVKFIVLENIREAIQNYLGLESIDKIERLPDETEYIYNKRVEYIQTELDKNRNQNMEKLILKSILKKNEFLYNLKY